MSDVYNIWEDKINGLHLPRFDELPDIELYMDQVISQLDKYFSPINNDEHVITASMINNYVKQQLLPAPIKKRYSRVHVAYIIAICLLKQSLSIPEIKILLDTHITVDNLNEQYNNICKMQEEAFAHTCNEIKSGTSDYFDAALNAALNSGADKIFAEHIINYKNDK